MFTQLKDYKIIKLIGKGSFGEVYKVSKDDKFYALKMYKISNEMNNSNSLSKKEKNENLKSIENEIKILSQLNNPFIVKLYEVFSINLNEEVYNIKDENNDEQIICLILELCENGDLNDKIKEKKQKNETFAEKEILHYFYEILQGLYYLHKNRVLHRDLKTLNIFLTKDNHIKIGDFGVSKKLINNNIYAYTFVGTPYYLSPEICQNKAYDEKSDVWSLGVIIYELITLNKPFDSQSQMGLFMKILKGKPAPIINTIKHNYSQKLINMVIENLLDKDPLTRYGILQTLNSGIFDKFFREKEIRQKMLEKKKNQKIINNNYQNNNNNQNNNLNNNQNRKNTNRNKATNNNKVNENPKIIKNKIITDSKRVRTNPLKGSMKANTLSRRAQLAKIPGKQNKPEASIHEKHIKMNNKYLNTYKEKISKGEPRITASKYLHDVLMNDNDEEMNIDSIPYQSTENKNLNDNNINTLNNNFYLENNNNINNEDEENNNLENNEEEDKIRPNFMLMNENINFDDNNYEEINDSNNLTELLKDSEFYGDNNKEEIPIIDNFEDFANNKKQINEIKDKEKTLEELEKEAYDKFGKEIVDDILNKYDEYQNDMNLDQTKELDELIFKKMNGDKTKYVDFLEIFYKIIYIKCAQQVEKTV